MAALNGPVRDQAIARRMQGVFKKQVQEWKNILLRGANARDGARYAEALRIDEVEVLAVAEFRREYAILDSAHCMALAPRLERCRLRKDAEIRRPRG